MAKEFVHLHLHSDYSLLDGACPVSWAKLKKEEQEGKIDIVQMVKKYGMKAAAITDHGVMGGCLEFHNAMKKEGLNPIIGCETYVAPGSRLVKDASIPHYRGFHLILLAENDEGYRNLCSLVSEAHVNGFYYKPRIDKEFLASRAKGLIGMSACLQGEIDVAALERGPEAAKKVLFEYLDIFGRGNFYLELMDHGLEDQKKVNRILLDLARQCDVPLVCTNDVHYLRREDAKAQEIMLCIQTRTTMSDERRMRMEKDEFYFKSPEEMAEIWEGVAPDALTNTLAVAERCNVAIGYANHYPEFTPPQAFLDTLDLTSIRAEAQKEVEAEEAKKREKTPDSPASDPDEMAYLTERRFVMKKAAAYLRSVCLYGTGNENSVCGFQKKYGYDPFNPPEDKKEDAEIKLKRMNYELEVISRMKYPSYFLCVWDFINWAKEHGIPVGPGRGSGAGSIVAFLTGITNIDPIKYDLLFERFLNPDRISPPDFDTDFCERRRQEVIDYVIGKYGKDSVSQIGTYGTLKAKAVLKDVARALDRTPAEGNMITKLVPDDPKMTLQKALKESPELRRLVEKEDWVRQVFQYSLPLEQLNRQMGIHACGVIICNEPLASLVPLGRGAHDEVITQYAAPLCESIGLLKMDFLGLRTLTVIQDACDNVRKSRGIVLDMDKISLDDPKTYELINKGDTVAVFQLESGGMQDLCRKFGVENIKHIIALVAIYRPGPMQFIDLFVGRKKGAIDLEYDHPLMEQFLKETYGIMLYQEQIMQVVQVLAGFSLSQADILRRAIGKKKVKDMEAQHDKFIEGCAKANAIPAPQAERIWENIKKFADYGFNKSHSAAYAILAYRTAYLKANFKPEFMAAVLTSELGNSEKLTFLINECRSSGIPILPPDVNHSDVNFTVDGEAIRFGLGAIKGIGQAVSQSILDGRSQGPYASMTDLIERTEGLNAKSLEALVRAGALDSFGWKRSQLVAMIDSCLQSANAAKRDKAAGQASLFDLLDEPEAAGFGEAEPPDLPEFPDAEKLDNEKSLLGFYVSGHPLDENAEEIKTFSSVNVFGIQKLKSDAGVKLGGLITSATKKFTKSDSRPFSIFQFEDLTGSIECVCFPKAYEKFAPLIEEGSKVFLRGIVKKEEGEEKSSSSIQVEDLIPLKDAMRTNTREVQIRLFENEIKDDSFANLERVLRKHPGEIPVLLCISTNSGVCAFVETARSYAVSVAPELLTDLDLLLGPGHWKLKRTDDVPVARSRGAWSREEKTQKETKS